MSDLERVNEWFDSGVLVRPSAQMTNFVDLTRALVRLAGATDVPTGPGEADLVDKIGPVDHLIFLLIDGLGAELVRMLPEDSFMPQHIAGELQSVFLSTTACALTTLATADWPAVHGVPGWWTYIDNRNISVTTLPFEERTTRQPLSELGVSPDELFPVPSVWSQMTHEVLTLLPAHISNSVYSGYTSGGTLRTGYRDFRQALTLVCKRVETARAPTFTYLYLPELDELTHRRGARSPDVGQLLLQIDWQISSFVRVIAGRARIVISSDHGAADVTDERRFILDEDDPLAQHLLCQPTAEASVPVFHVKDGREEAFRAGFTERFGQHCALLTPDEAQALKLLGPGPLGDVMRSRLGTFIGIAPQPIIFAVQPVSGSAKHIGVHGGLTPQQMNVPLILM